MNIVLFDRKILRKRRRRKKWIFSIHWWRFSRITFHAISIRIVLIAVDNTENKLKARERETEMGRETRNAYPGVFFLNKKPFSFRNDERKKESPNTPKWVRWAHLWSINDIIAKRLWLWHNRIGSHNKFIEFALKECDRTQHYARKPNGNQ